MIAFARWGLLAASAILIAGCATLTGNDPLQVNVAGIEPLEGQGLELRMMVKLRVQNPNDAPIDYSGVALEMNVQGKAFASGVSDASGNVPGFGEAVISVPVTISAFRMASRALDMAKGNTGKISYELKGKLGGSMFGAARFSTKGELDMPTTIGAAQ
jgi:LEA14-like dessication related protein